MRIVIDLQGAQAIGSRNRGIGRYSLSIAKAIVRNKKEHDVHIVLSILFPETIEKIQNDFKQILPERNIHIWHTYPNLSHITLANNWRRKTAELSRESFIASLNPDIVYITSLFEGLGDDCVTSIGLFSSNIPTVVTLFDLIPLINSSPYLDNPNTRKWYEEKIKYLKKADMLLAISESSRQEALEHLDYASSNVINISTAADTQFKKINITKIQELNIRKQYGIEKPFLMYTGGIDYRKNIEGLIRAYARLPKHIQESHQLAIICSINPSSKILLETLAKKEGLAKGTLILTGYVPEEDLIFLYNLCKAFIFPSWHEGFGLPALEAMWCGVPVIASNSSSLPEVIGLKDALFDPFSDKDMAKKIEQVLEDEVFRERLMQHGSKQVKKFSWDISAKKAIKAFEILHERNQSNRVDKSVKKRLKLAYISPLPPVRSGISDYSTELLPELSKYYDIDVIVEQKSVNELWIREHCKIYDTQWFKQNASMYDRILYHFGNSHFHQHMFNLLLDIPGVVVLHDFFLSDVISHMSMYKYENHSFMHELYYSHGYRIFQDNRLELQWKYPCNKRVLDYAKGIIVHSDYSKKLAEHWYEKTYADDWSVIPHLRKPADKLNREKIRQKLGIPSNATLVCSFGMMGPTKMNDRLLNAWLNSSLGNDKKCYLIFVGENQHGDYGNKIVRTIKKSNSEKNIQITGWIDSNTFREYLSVADIGVQLRTLSRGETSGTVLDCMNYALATIVNANGSIADLPEDAVCMIPDEFTDLELIRALEELYVKKDRRKRLGDKACEVILNSHIPQRCAEQYVNAIELYYARIKNEQDGLIEAIVKISLEQKNSELIHFAQESSKNYQLAGEKQILLDISQLFDKNCFDNIRSIVELIFNDLLQSLPLGYRVEPIYLDTNTQQYKYARKFSLNCLSVRYIILEDDITEFKYGDIFLELDMAKNTVEKKKEFYNELHFSGLSTYHIPISTWEKSLEQFLSEQVIK